jgi:long-subunit acyl-CoA synthetase (AMP-forming)
VLIKHENVVAAMTGQKERVFPMVDLENDIYIAYLPLAHILELRCGLFIYLKSLIEKSIWNIL